VGVPDAPPFLRGDRVELHAPSEADAAFVHRASVDERLWRTGFTPLPRDHATVAEFLREEANADGRVDFLVRVPEADSQTGVEPGEEADGTDTESADDPEVTRRAGMVSLTDVDYRRSSATVGYWLVPAVQGHGYATEAVGRVLSYAFDTLALHRIEATVDAPNDPSIGVLESLGFTHEGTRRAARVLDGDRVDMHDYGLLVDEWEG